MYAENKLKLLIVDDEVFMREGLKVYLDWEQYAIGKILTAEDGTSALEIAETEKPNLIITDIKMPEMTGLELISRMKKILPDCVCVIVSGYNDFEYAKKSVELGAFYYMVKPIELEELKAVISNAVDAVKKRAKEKEMLFLFDETSKKQKNYLTQDFFSKLLSENNELFEAQLIAKAMDTLEMNFRFPYYAICVTRQSSKGALSKTQAFEIFSITQQKTKDTFSKKWDGGVHCMIEKNNLVTILGIQTLEKMEQRAEEMFRFIFESISGCFHLSLISVLGPTISNIGDLFLSYTGAEKLCAYRAFFGDSGFFIAQDYADSAAIEPFLFSAEDKTRFFSMITSNDIPGISGMLKTLKTYAAQSYYQDKNVLFSFLLELMICALRILDAKKLKLEQYTNIELFTCDFLQTFANATQLFEWLVVFFTMISNAYCNQKSTELESLLTGQIKKYAQENISENLNLSKIAHYFHYNTNYIGRLFKKTEKKKFSDYLNDIRIEHTCKLLETSDLSVEEIAYQNGYHDCQYFIKIFKTKMGTTPRKYRTGAGRNEYGGENAENN